jgi:hypothetical protein
MPHDGSEGLRRIGYASTMRMQGPVLLAATLVAAACDGDPGGRRDALEAGWTPRFDVAGEATVEPRFFEHADGIEVKPGPNVNLWHPQRTASGRFRLSVDVTHLDSGLHPHGAGLTFGGSEVHGDTARYTYFLVRGDRNFLIKTRAGNDTPDVVQWTEHAAIAPENKQGVTKNRLTVEARDEEVRFLVNGVEVHRRKRSGLPVDGQYGFRLVHDLHVVFGVPVIEELE